MFLHVLCQLIMSLATKWGTYCVYFISSFFFFEHAGHFAQKWFDQTFKGIFLMVRCSVLDLGFFEKKACDHMVGPDWSNT